MREKDAVGHGRCSLKRYCHTLIAAAVIRVAAMET
jgi:hypothetical protein